MPAIAASAVSNDHKPPRRGLNERNVVCCDPTGRMEQTMMAHEGGCLCGAVRFTAEGEPLNVRVCHCRLCQKSMGAPFFARAMFEQKAITLEGPVGRYPSSDRLERIFCQRCGTRIGTWRVNGTAAGL